MSDATVENKVIVNILGEEYPITASNDPEYISRVADLVDSRMKEVAGSNRTRAKDKIAILVALSFASELVEKNQNLSTHEQEFSSRVDRLVARLDEVIADKRSDRE